MALCEFCKLDMSADSTKSCILVKVGNLKPIRYGEEERFELVDADDRCHDCNVAEGGYHHPGCDMEECPRCHGQAISCGCPTQ